MGATCAPVGHKEREVGAADDAVVVVGLVGLQLGAHGEAGRAQLKVVTHCAAHVGLQSDVSLAILAKGTGAFGREKRGGEGKWV